MTQFSANELLTGPALASAYSEYRVSPVLLTYSERIEKAAHADFRKIGRVMVFDQQPGTFCILSTTLPYDVVWVPTEAEALRVTNRETFDLVVLDISVGDVQWPDLLQTIRSRSTSCEVIAAVPAGQLPSLRQVAGLGVDAIFLGDDEVGALFRRIGRRVPRDMAAHSPWRLGNEHVDRALGYLGRHFPKRVSVQQIARAIGVSVGHLTHVFGVAAGMTIKEFTLRLKVELAKRLLLGGNSSLAELADECDFCDASHLSRVFRRFEGCWPGEFRANRGDPAGSNCLIEPPRSGISISRVEQIRLTPEASLHRASRGGGPRSMSGAF